MATELASFSVLTAPAEGELREKGSRFLARLVPVSSREEAGRYRQELARDARDATHLCWAERLGWPPEERSSDAGEPAGTAGQPILRVLKGAELSDVLGVVVRWFGGTKLGKGGLARAYSGAIKLALEAGCLERRSPVSELVLSLGHHQVGAVKRLLQPGRVDLVSEDYLEDAEIVLSVRADLEPEFAERLSDLRIAFRKKNKTR